MKTTWNMEVLPLNVCADSTSQRADFCMRLKPLLEDELNKNKEYQLFEDIEMPLMPVLAEMEYNGVTIDTNVLKDISVLFNERLKNYEKQVHDISGRDFNISSPRQVGEILFDVLKLDSKAKKTKTGQYETSEATLEALRYKSPIIEPILCYRAMKKLLSTYVDALPTLVNPQTQHIHTSFNQAVTATGRLSSSDPNLQNIPVRGEDGKEIRKAFIPEPGQLFFSADYSQIELRILAHLSNDEQMKMAFIEGHDIHAATAAKIYHKDIKDVTTDERRKAKTANFGIVYGITTFGLSQRIGISRSEAKELIDSYFATFSNIKSYIEQIVETARQQGYVETIFRRRRYLPDINSQNAVVRKFAERNAVNAPIQGSAADIIKVAMIRIAKRFKEENIQSKMILQVHDELNFSVLPEEKERVQAIVQYEMAHACNLSVPLVADCGWGKNWLESH
jgi:DNA polymerase-1